MNTTNSEGDNNLKSAQNYYKAMLAKDFDKMASYLHDSVHFVGPLAEMHGKDAVVSAAKNFGSLSCFQKNIQGSIQKIYM